MAFSACKVPVNQRAKACMKAFHKLRKMAAWRRLSQSQRNGFNQRAIEIDETMIKAYDGLLMDMADAMDERSGPQLKNGGI